MSTMVLPRMWADTKRLSLNGTDELAYINNPSYGTHTAGTIIVDFEAKSLMGTNGVKVIWGINDATNGSNDATFFFSRRCNASFGDSDNHFDILYRPSSGGSFYTGGANGHDIATGTVYRVAITSQVKMYIDKVDQSLMVWNGSALPSNVWLGSPSLAGGRCFAAGCLYRGGSGLNYNDCYINNVVVYNRVLTSAEITEEYDAIRAGRSPWSCSFADAIVSAYPMEDTAKDHNDFTNDLTGVGIDGSNYVSP